jgi:hypothetical protein
MILESLNKPEMNKTKSNLSEREDPEKFNNDYHDLNNKLKSIRCQKHSKKIQVICTDSECRSTLLCLFDIKRHNHPNSLYYIDQISKSDYIEELFCNGEVSNQEYKTKIEQDLDNIKIKIDFLFDEFKKEALKKVNQKLENIPMMSKMKRLQELQMKWIETNALVDLQAYSKELDGVFINELNEKNFVNLNKITQVYENMISDLKSMSESICSSFGKIITTIKASDESEEIPSNQMIMNDLLIKSKQNQLSISSQDNFFLPLQLNQFSKFVKILNETFLKKNHSIEEMQERRKPNWNENHLDMESNNDYSFSKIRSSAKSNLKNSIFQTKYFKKKVEKKHEEYHKEIMKNLSSKNSTK